MRPANIITAIADILAGVAISGYLMGKSVDAINFTPIFLLILSTIGLYGGGVVMNDVFDAELDAIERPERPIPSGLIPKMSATVFAVALLTVGIVAAYLMNNPVSGFIAFAIAIAAVVYDKWGKHLSFFGPINMGLCRGLNLLLGISIIPESLLKYWYVALIPVVYIAAITMISRGEVYGGRKATLNAAGVFYSIVIAAILFIGFLNHSLEVALPFLLSFGFMIFKPLFKAIKKPIGPLIGNAVKFGVLALILMNAAWAAAFGAVYWALIIILLLPLSVLLAKIFAVT